MATSNGHRGKDGKIRQSQYNAVKKYNATHYDKIDIRVPKGDKEKIAESAKNLGYSSVNQFIREAIQEKIDKSNKDED